LEIVVTFFVFRRVADSNSRSDFVREVEMLMGMSHPCIVPFLGYFLSEENRDTATAVAYINGCSLTDVVASNDSPVWWNVTIKSQTVAGSVLAMLHAHSHGIIHRTLSPENILLDLENYRVRLGDFGLSRFNSRAGTDSRQIGDPRYMAPEMYEESGYGLKADIFSFGLLLFEIVVGVPVFSPELLPQQIMKRALFGRRPQVPADVPEFVRGLIESCWSVDPDDRPDFSAIFSILEGNGFKIFEDVDSGAVVEFVSRVKSEESTESLRLI
jgi:serine/threonine protein kinase